MKHIALFTRAIPLHSIGGMEVMTWDLAQELVRTGFRITVVTARVSGRERRFLHQGIEVLTIECANYRRYSGQFWKGTLTAFDELARDGLSAVIGVSSAARAVALKRPDRKIPVLMQAHGSSIGEFVSKLRQPSLRSLVGSMRNLLWVLKDRRVLPKYDAVVAISDVVRRQIELSAGLFKAHAPIRVINNGIDQDLFKFDLHSRKAARAELGWGDASIIIACACRLHKQKGVAPLIAAFRILKTRRTDAKLLIIGDGPERKRLEDVVRSAELTDAVKFVGEATRSKVAYWLNAADVFSFLTLRVEGQPLNQLEALAIGLPSIVSTKISNRFPGACGLAAVDPQRPETVAAVMDEIIDQAQSGTRASLPPSFSLNHCALSYVALLRLLVAP
jgi:glycosyltransferase involved in cell wall biosynthesis